MSEQIYVVRLGHFTHISDRQFMPRAGVREEWKENYLTQDVLLPRPEVGSSIVSAYCDVCGEEISIRINSKGVVFKRRIFCAIIATCLSVFIYMVYAYSTEDQGLLRFVAVFTIFGVYKLLSETFSDEFGFAVDIIVDQSKHKVFKASERIRRLYSQTPLISSEHDYYETKAPLHSPEEIDPRGKRFYITYVWVLSLLLIMQLITTLNINKGFVGIKELASNFILISVTTVLMALFPGLIAMFIPTTRKIIFVPVSILICLIIVVIWLYSIGVKFD